MNVELNAVNKHFGQVHANKEITLKIPTGSIQGILGENGAGKSTLMKILSGYIQADSGSILLNDKLITINSPADAIRHGIGMLHQDPLDFPPMKVIDNFLVGGGERHRGGELHHSSEQHRHGTSIFPNYKQITKEITELAGQFGFALDPEAYIDALTVGERQQVEILRLLWLGVQVLILDEPTTGISTAQKKKLFSTLKILAEQGKTVIFVSHKLEDVEVLCDRVAVLRQGELVGESFPPYDTDHLVSQMFGKVITLGSRIDCTRDAPVLELHGVSIEDYRLSIQDVSLQVRAGEVIGLAGMEGSGQPILLRTCAGLVRSVAGKICINNKDLTGKSHHVFKRHGTAYMPASRMEEGLIPGLTLTEHFVLSDDKRHGMFIEWDKAKRNTEKQIQEFNIRGTPSTNVEALSGGNQQRALLALLNEPLSLILMEHPTRGLDIESSIYIWRKLKERCRQGAAILFISSDLEEILHYSDRILVFFAGKVSKPIDAASTTVDQLGQLIGGKGMR